MRLPETGASSHEMRGSIAGGAVAAVALFATVLGVGSVGSFEALRLIEAMLGTARFLAATVIGGSLTVLALLLTVLGLSLSSSYKFSARLYTRARYLTRLSVIGIVLGTLILLAVTIPIGEVEEFRIYYAFFYYTLAAALAILGGLVVAIGLLIGATLRGLIAIGHPQAESDLLQDDPVPDASSANPLDANREPSRRARIRRTLEQRALARRGRA